MAKTTEERIRERLQESWWMRMKCAEDGGMSWFTRAVRQSAIRTVRQMCRRPASRDYSVPKNKGRRLYLEKIEPILDDSTYAQNTKQDQEK